MFCHLWLFNRLQLSFQPIHYVRYRKLNEVKITWMTLVRTQQERCNVLCGLVFSSWIRCRGTAPVLSSCVELVSGGILVAGEGAAALALVRSFAKRFFGSKRAPPLPKVETITISVINVSKRGNLFGKALFCFGSSFLCIIGSYLEVGMKENER